MEESQCESEQEPSLDLESPKYSEANERIKKAEREQLEKLNLSELKLIEVPQELLDLTHLKRLHLCRNRLLEIPEELCLRLCHLRWLDLRSNLITRLPATVKHMRDLRILLLDDNSIRILPFELGLLRKLKGIYIRNNPLEFPKKQVMERGVHGILKYLFQCYLSREECASPRGSRLYQKIMEDDKATPLEGNNSAEVVASNYPTTKDSSRNGSEVAEDSVKSLCENFEEKLSIPGTDKGIGSEEESKSPEDLSKNCENPSNPLLLEEPEKIMKDQQTQSTTSWDSNYDSYDLELEEILHYSKLADAMNVANADEESNSTNSAPLQIARSGTLPWASSSTRLYKKIKKQYLFGRRNPKKLTSTTVFGLFPSQSVRHEILLPDNPPHPTIDKIRAQHINEKKCKARQQAMITQQATLQKLKDAERVRGWRQAYTEQQKAKLLEYLSKTQRDIREEADKRAVAAPFDVGREHLKMIGTAELNALRNRCIRSATPPPNLSAQMVLELEMASFERDRRLTEKVQRHLADVGGRFQIPMPNSREALYTEMLTAKRDLDLALRLHHRVKLRLETLEHFRGSNRRDLWS